MTPVQATLTLLLHLLKGVKHHAHVKEVKKVENHLLKVLKMAVVLNRRVRVVRKAVNHRGKGVEIDLNHPQMAANHRATNKTFAAAVTSVKNG